MSGVWKIGTLFRWQKIQLYLCFNGIQHINDFLEAWFSITNL